jgi:dihydrofolate reductase
LRVASRDLQGDVVHHVELKEERGADFIESSLCLLGALNAKTTKFHDRRRRSVRSCRQSGLCPANRLKGVTGLGQFKFTALKPWRRGQSVRLIEGSPIARSPKGKQSIGAQTCLNLIFSWCEYRLKTGHHAVFLERDLKQFVGPLVRAEHERSPFGAVPEKQDQPCGAIASEAPFEFQTGSRCPRFDLFEFLCKPLQHLHVGKHMCMSKLRFEISVSVDGYVAGPNQTEEEPLGEGGEQLHEWAIELAAWRESHGREGGEVNASSEIAERAMENVGAVIMGRKMFGGVPGPWDEEPWRGWWGDEPPFHVPVFILTHHEREPLPMEGGTTFHFVSGGIEAALEQAREAANGMDVKLAGGAEAAQQYLAAGLVDEMQLNVPPVLLGGGERLFENVGSDLQLVQEQVVHTPKVTHVRYAVSTSP